MKKRLLSIIIALCLLSTMLPLQAFAVGGAVITPATANGKGLQDAINAANSGDTVKLNADIIIDPSKTELFITKNITLDLNGYTISSSISGNDDMSLKALLTNAAAWTFTITDSSSSGNGRIISDANYCVLIANSGSGEVILEKGNILTTGEKGYGLFNLSNGRISISGGTISSESAYAV